MRAIIDADIFRYELGFGAETGWNAITEGREQIPPFNYVEDKIHARIESILSVTGADKYTLYHTEGKTFRYDIAVTKPYKGTRIEKKPWHYDNLTAYFKGVLGSSFIAGLEADDAMAIDHVTSDDETILVTRDKDLRQVPGLFYSYELGRQPGFGPIYISNPGTIELSEDHKKLIATGLVSFYGQVLTGDRVDNIPGLDKCGPVAAFDILTEAMSYDPKIWPKEMYLAVLDAYKEYYVLANDADTLENAEENLLEQGRLCWMTRRLNEDGSPVLWELGMEE